MHLMDKMMAGVNMMEMMPKMMMGMMGGDKGSSGMPGMMAQMMGGAGQTQGGMMPHMMSEMMPHCLGTMLPNHAQGEPDGFHPEDGRRRDGKRLRRADR